jgi:hypothetical protein
MKLLLNTLRRTMKCNDKDNIGELPKSVQEVSNKTLPMELRIWLYYKGALDNYISSMKSNVSEYCVIPVLEYITYLKNNRNKLFEDENYWEKVFDGYNDYLLELSNIEIKDKLLHEFMMNKGLYTKYICEYLSNPSHTIDKIENIPSAFVWNDTYNGHTYWRRINNEFEEYKAAIERSEQIKKEQKEETMKETIKLTDERTQPKTLQDILEEIFGTKVVDDLTNRPALVAHVFDRDNTLVQIIALDNNKAAVDMLRKQAHKYLGFTVVTYKQSKVHALDIPVKSEDA